jgi:hypothetical protein
MHEGIINSQGCVHVDDDCCGHTMPILLKNCSDFVVYFLQPTPACDMAYCAGHMVPCPLGLESDTGFTPCQCKCKNTNVFFCKNTKCSQIICMTATQKVNVFCNF